jgi:glycosyltransferase involved in cell wall biosynthesis
MENINKIAVTLIIPTLNCAVQASKHLESIDQILPNVQEIIAIDSGSIDGTYEILLEKLTRYKAKIISTKPGLYQAWNQAAKIATQPYVYFSTISDTITLDGLKKLVTTAQINNLDGVISPPKISYSIPTNEPVRWPIHRFLEYYNTSKELIIPTPEQNEMLACIFIPESIIGSSASNIYRADFLKQYPFPEEQGHAGDVYWTIDNLKKMKIGIIKDELAEFCYDGKRFISHENTFKTFEKLMNYIYSDKGNSFEKSICVAVHQYTNKIFSALVSTDKLKKIDESTKSYYTFRRSLRHPCKVLGELIENITFKAINKLQARWFKKNKNSHV